MKARRPKRDKSGPASWSPQILVGGRGWFARRLVGIVTGVALLALCSHARAQGKVNGEYQLKLAFLYNFAQFVQWPADAFGDSGAPLTICVAGENPFQGEIEQSLRGRAVEGHAVELRRLDPSADPHSCQMIFVRVTEVRAARRILANSKGSTTLTVGEAKGFAQGGGMINLIREENRLRFEVNIDAAARSRLKLSSKLLALAKIVKE
jgi:hypothetical protein